MKRRPHLPHLPHLPRLRPALPALLLLLLAPGVAAAQTGRLEPGDSQIASGEYVDPHPFEGVAGAPLDVSLASTEFDPYLIVVDAAGRTVLEVDDSAGAGLDVRERWTPAATGTYTAVVTSARPGEVGAYTLSIAPAAPAPAAPPAPGGNPLDLPPLPGGDRFGAPPAPAADPWSGTFGDGALTVVLRGDGASYEGEVALRGETYPLVASLAGGALSGSFRSGGQDFPFTATLQGGSLSLATGGATYLLPRLDAPAPAAPANPLAPPAPGGDTGASPAPATALAPRIAPEPGYVTGTVFDTLGNPLPGAGVLVRGVTYAQGQAQSFETVTGPDGTYRLRVPDGRWEAKAWIDRAFDGHVFSRLLHPLSGSYETEVDSAEGGSLDFQWRLRGLAADTLPPGEDDTDFYGASIDLSYCGLPADAYCDARYTGFEPAVPGGTPIELALEPVGPLLDGSAGRPLRFAFTASPILPDYPAPTGGGRLVLGSDWEYHSDEFFDIPVGRYRLSVVAVLPDGSRRPLRVGLSDGDVEHAAVEIGFRPWEGYQARSYSGGGLEQLRVYVRD